MQRNTQKKLSDFVKFKFISRKETYKYYSALGRTEFLFSINKLIFSDFIAHKIFLYDGDKLAEMDITFSGIKGRPKFSKFQPRTALIRCEFMEIILRLALKRYYDSICNKQH